jgi:SAM-dependent methyltransferase
MTDVWSERAEQYRTSDAHREGPDLDLLVEWAAGAGTALDVATGGGHVARRLREAGIEVVSSDPAPGMQPDVVCAAEHLPFADGSFDVVVTRVAAHHFEDIGRAVAEMARVAARSVLIVDNCFMSEDVEEAEKLRDPSHVRNYSEAEWRTFAAEAGLEVEDVRFFEKPIEYQPWLDRCGCSGEDAARVRELLGDRVSGDHVVLDRIALRCGKAHEGGTA